jgi:exosome complex RNA-binding protein Rrp4
MITSKEEAKEYCKKYEINISAHKSVIVTANGSIYLDTENIDPADSPERFVLKGKEEAKKEEAKEEVKKESKEEKKKKE